MMRQRVSIAIAALAFAVPIAGQQPDSQVADLRATLERLTQTVERARTLVESRITRGAPYSAEAITEFVQVLGDGNRITQKNTVRVYRDSEGRTRREQLAANGTDIVTINISDPVAESTYVLNPQTRIAHRNGMIMASPSEAGARGGAAPFIDGVVIAPRSPSGEATGTPRSATAEAARREEETKVVARGGGGGVPAEAVPAGGGRGGRGRGGAVGPAEYPPMVAARVPAAAGTTTREDLGQQVLEGLAVTGTRSTTVIPAGAIGNDRPIQIVSEQWFSPDLQVLVLTKHSDPRTGENTYRLTNVVQTEPARTLFEVPADYTLRDSVIRRQAPLMP